MLELAIVLAVFLVIWAVVHTVIAVYFSTRVVNDRPTPAGAWQPKAAVVLSVRGWDPSLERTVIGLLELDYPDYQVIVVVDHQSDIAWNAVDCVQREFDCDGRLRIHELNTPLDSCSLKCSALVQALNHLDPGTEVLVLIDADVTPYAGWLRNVVAPLADPEVGVVTGNQWFAAEDDAAGSLIRSLWNAGALVPTAILANPWAGSCAMRMDDVRAAGLANVWKRSIVDDGPLRRALSPLGLKIRFHPDLIMVNRERCTADYVNRYVTRMLTWSRMYERTFVNTVVHMLITNVLLLSAVMFLVITLSQQHWIAAAFTAGGLVGNSLLMLLAYMIVRDGVARTLQRRDEQLSSIPIPRAAKLAVLIPVCQIAYGWWLLRAVFSRRIQWREITYEVRGRNSVTMLRYQPLTVEANPAPSKVSL